MSDKTDDGGPAFPQNDLSGYGMGPSPCNNSGLSLRDYFAAKAMQAIITAEGMSIADEYADKVASFAYDFADSMLKERSKSDDLDE
jgi:hypothetical protein